MLDKKIQVAVDVLPSREVVDAVKLRIIKLYCKNVKSLQKGYKNDFSELMDLIHYLEISEKIDDLTSMKIYEHLMN